MHIFHYIDYAVALGDIFVYRASPSKALFVLRPCSVESFSLSHPTSRSDILRGSHAPEIFRR